MTRSLRGSIPCLERKVEGCRGALGPCQPSGAVSYTLKVTITLEAITKNYTSSPRQTEDHMWGRKRKERRKKGGEKKDEKGKHKVENIGLAPALWQVLCWTWLLLPLLILANATRTMVFIFILQIYKLRLRCVETFAHIVTARNWQSQDLNLALFMFSLNHPACQLEAVYQEASRSSC